MKKKYVVFIPVRGGSKSIPMKNIKQINGRPLVYWILDAARKCDEVEQVYVSTDSLQIAETIRNYKLNTQDSEKIVCIKRSEETSTDIASTESAMLEFALQNDFENIILLQATSPLTDANCLTDAIKFYENNKFDSILSVVNQKRFIWEYKNGYAKAVNYNYCKRPRRQDFEGFFVENGAIYITSRQLFLESKCRISGRIGLFEMDASSYFEIDESSDWIIVEDLLINKNKKDKGVSKEIKLVVMDCDGVLTDGGMYYTRDGDVMKKFNTKDGMGIARLKERNIKTAIITGENTNIVKKRADKIGIDYCYLGIKDKLKSLKEILKKEEIDFKNVAYIGDDVNDIECLKTAGISIAVLNAVEDVKSVSDIVLKNKGGDGAVREAIDFILHN